MADAELVDRLAALSGLAEIPRDELEWLVAHGQVQVYEAGDVIAPKGEPIEKLWIILFGHIAIRVDRGAGPRRVTEWRTGAVTGMLPYSRLTRSPGNNYLEETTEVLAVHQEHFPEMVHVCPVFTAHTVHGMLDRADAGLESEIEGRRGHARRRNGSPASARERG